MVALKSEAAWRSVRMMRTAMEPTITHWLDDPAIVEIMLNPDGRLWIDRLAGGLSDTAKRLSAQGGERIVRLVTHHVGRRGASRIAASYGRAAGRSCRETQPLLHDVHAHEERGGDLFLGLALLAQWLKRAKLVEGVGRRAVNIRRLRALEALAERPGTPAEGAATQAAIERIQARLGITPRRPARPPKPKPRTWRDLPFVMRDDCVRRAERHFRGLQMRLRHLRSHGRRWPACCAAAMHFVQRGGRWLQGNTLRPPLPIER
jgi:hypothetical protein